MQQHAFRWLNAEASEDAGFGQWQFDHLSDEFEFLVESADILVGDARGRSTRLARLDGRWLVVSRRRLAVGRLLR